MIWRKKHLSEFGNNVYRCKGIRNGLLWCLALKMLFCFTENNYELNAVHLTDSSDSKKINGNEIGDYIRSDSRGVDCFIALFKNADKITFSAKYKEQPFSITLFPNDYGRIKSGSLFDFESEFFTTRELKDIVEVIHMEGNYGR